MSGARLPPILPGAGPSPGCPNATIWRSSCKKRSCLVCGVRWARDWYTSMRENLEELGRPVVVIAITAPGVDRLPWDLAFCAGRRTHAHSGKGGCRVEQRAAREWTETCSWRWSLLRNAAAQAVRRELGERPWIVERVWELQKRGAPHLHVVLPYGPPAERQAAQLFANELARLAPKHDFGYVDVKLRPRSGTEAASYLAAYFLGGRRKDSIRDTVRMLDERAAEVTIPLPSSLLWLTPRLTRRTRITIRTLRRARHLWAVLNKSCAPPRWRDMTEAVTIALVFRRIYGRGDADDDPLPALAFAARLDARVGLLHRWSDDYQAELTRYASILAVAA